MKKYSEMNEAERAAWGDAEAAARRADLKGVNAAPSAAIAMTLVIAQSNAEKRRRLIGATVPQATVLVIQSTRRTRGMTA